MSQNFNEPKPERSFLDAVGGEGCKLTVETIKKAKQQVESAPQSGWVIVRGVVNGYPLQYYAVVPGEYGAEVKWTVENQYALRFARKQDAEAVICLGVGQFDGDQSNVRAEEHVWL